jgi:hypothetical protein
MKGDVVSFLYTALLHSFWWLSIPLCECTPLHFKSSNKGDFIIQCFLDREKLSFEPGKVRNLALTAMD